METPTTPTFFRGMILDEVNRLKQLNECERNCKNAIEKVERKCRTSNFKKQIFNKTLREINRNRKEG